MRRALFFLTFIIIASAAAAQTGLGINRLFGGKYADDPEVTEILMSGTSKFLTRNNLTVLASFKGPSKTYASIIQPLVVADGRGAKGRNVRYRDGQLYFAFYELKPTANGLKRYIYYVNNMGAKKPTVTLIYLEGKLSSDEASTLIQDTANKKNAKK